MMRTLSKISCFLPSFSLLLLGAFLLSGMPTPAKAGFLSSIFGGDAYAEQSEPVISNPPSKSPQTMDLLQANVSSALIIQEKNEKKEKKKETSTDPAAIDTTATVNIVSDNAMLPATGPLGVSDGKDDPKTTLEETSVYVVRKGDNISAIAEMFGVSVNTILWANDMKKGEKLVAGDVLFILPVSGLEHTVTKGQTLKSIAKLYKVSVSDIIESNDIAEDTKLAVGDKLMVPDAVKAEESDKPIKNLAASIAKDKSYYELHPIQNLSGYFINPVPGYRKSQGIHDRNGVDLALAKGNPIYASAAGTVTLARNGYNGGFGNLVIISHPNGTETLYAHQSKLATKTGAQVAQGEIIGYVGSTGRSTGPHLHFEVHGARNPGADGSWAN